MDLNKIQAVPQLIEVMCKNDLLRDQLTKAVVIHADAMDPLYKTSFLSDFLRLINGLNVVLDNPVKVEITVDNPEFSARVLVTNHPLDPDHSVGYVIQKCGLLPLSELAKESMSYNLMSILMPQLLAAGYKELDLFYLSFEGLKTEE